MKFRPATKTDLKTVISWIPDAASCERWAGPKVGFPLLLEQLCRDLQFDKTLNYSLHDEKELLAFGQIRMFDNSRGHLSRIVVNPLFRGKGVGRIFVKELVNQAKKLECQTISLHVVRDNSIAIRLYEGLGFFVPRKQPENLRENIFYMELTQSTQ